jgi:uncharacterized protein YbjT (DUF2867 family)
MRILVLGGYGLIGLGVIKRLLADGQEVVGAGRSPGRGRALAPQAKWLACDLADHTTAESWAEILRNIDVVVNCSGVLQESARDPVTIIQRDAIVALVRGCELSGASTFIQISAPDASPDAATNFLRTKGEADDALRQSKLTWTILKPGLVIAPTAYGGTSLVRMLAGFPVIQPIVLPDASIQTVSLADISEAVSLSLDGTFADQEFDLVEEQSHSLEDLVAQFRQWQGFRPARLTLKLPKFMGYTFAKGADIAGWLGWRSALRTTSLKVLERGVHGDPNPWARASGRMPSSLSDTLNLLPSTLQERIFARTQLMFPLMLLTLAGFWIASGMIGIWQLEAAAFVLKDKVSDPVAYGFVIIGAVADLTIGGMLLSRRYMRAGCIAAFGLSAIYLIAGSILTPHLWADPLGPFIKIFPGMVLALGVAALAEER